MTAFNTFTNTPSLSYTNSYGTAQLMPSATPQYSWGFERTSGWRYFEFYVDDGGGDVNRLLFGLNQSPQAINDGLVYGSNSRQAGLVAGHLDPVYPYNSFAYTLSVTTGDTVMFAVDLTGGARDHAGTAQISGTISSGSGSVLTPAYYEIGVNGTWSGGGVVGWAWPSGGYPMRARPLVVRDSTSASMAKVSLRVETTSFVYAIPSGMIAWGDGPEGVGTSTTDDFGLAWDPTQKNRFSLSGSNLYAVNNATAEFPTTGYQMTINLAGLTGKRYLELWDGPTRVAGEYAVGIVDSTVLTNTFFDQPVNALFWKSPSTAYRRGVSLTACVTNGALDAVVGNVNFPGCGIMIDFDNHLYWHCQPYAPGGGGGGPWVGEATVSAFTGAMVTPYSFGAAAQVYGFPISITASTTQLRIAIKIRMDDAESPIYINGGQQPFSFYPLLPGAKSMNGGRQVLAGAGDAWDTVNNPASATYAAANVSILKRYIGVAQCAGIKSSGKKYFEIHSEQDSGINGVYMGLRLASATTFTSGVIATLLDTALLVQARSNGGARFRYGTNIGSWTASSSGGAEIAPWHGVAVDFDAGNIWIGSWNYIAKTMNWGASSDPAAGTNPHLTFTAGTQLRICIIDESGAGKNWGRVNLIQDTNNVVGLPTGFDPWGSSITASATLTPSAGVATTTASGALRVLWPYGVQT